MTVPDNFPVKHTFKHYCNCGSFAWKINGRREEDPHMAWCPQDAEYREWWAMKEKEKKME